MTDFNTLVGKTLIRIEGAEIGSESITFYADDGTVFRQRHHQDCCETVEVNEIHGEISDLIGAAILQADEVSYDNTPAPDGSTGYDSYTWTFYNLATAHGYVTIRWLGESNGYYSESVYFEQVT